METLHAFHVRPVAAKSFLIGTVKDVSNDQILDQAKMHVAEREVHKNDAGWYLGNEEKSIELNGGKSDDHGI